MLKSLQLVFGPRDPEAALDAARFAAVIFANIITAIQRLLLHSETLLETVESTAQGYIASTPKTQRSPLCDFHNHFIILLRHNGGWHPQPCGQRVALGIQPHRLDRVL